jgi:hypothetical protein
LPLGYLEERGKLLRDWVYGGILTNLAVERLLRRSGGDVGSQMEGDVERDGGSDDSDGFVDSDDDSDEDPSEILEDLNLDIEVHHPETPDELLHPEFDKDFPITPYYIGYSVEPLVRWNLYVPQSLLIFRSHGSETRNTRSRSSRE